MHLKPNIKNSQGYIQVGMTFFLIGITASLIADGRLIGAFFTNIIHEGPFLSTLQGFADGLSLPMFGASIYFNLRGLTVQRPR